MILAAQFATLADATAELAGPLVVALALAGLLLHAARGARGPRPWAPAPPPASSPSSRRRSSSPGSATFAGYIKLDDTATYLAMTDRVMEHGRSLAGLAPSTYEATLATTLAIGYPTGSLMPLGVGHQLLAYDSAWLYQPYLAFLAAMLALALYAVLGRVVASAPLRAFAAFVAAQPALLYGYALWGGIKEVSGALLLALIGALVPWTLEQERGPRARAAPGRGLRGPGLRAQPPGRALARAAAARRGGRRAATAFARTTAEGGRLRRRLAVLAVPAFVAAVDWLPRIGDFGKESNLGNLIGPLSGWQLFGIWPIGDFRVRPDDLTPVYVLVAVVIAAGVVGLWWAWQRRRLGAAGLRRHRGDRLPCLRRRQLAVGRREDARDGRTGRARGGDRRLRRAARERAVWSRRRSSRSRSPSA